MGEPPQCGRCIESLSPEKWKKKFRYRSQGTKKYFFPLLIGRSILNSTPFESVRFFSLVVQKNRQGKKEAHDHQPRAHLRVRTSARAPPRISNKNNFPFASASARIRTRTSILQGECPNHYATKATDEKLGKNQVYKQRNLGLSQKSRLSPFSLASESGKKNFIFPAGEPPQYGRCSESLPPEKWIFSFRFRSVVRKGRKIFLFSSPPPTPIF